MRNHKPPQTYAHLKRDFQAAVEKVCHRRTIQRCFIRAYERNAQGDRDSSLVPQQLLDFYSECDEESCDENVDDDIKWDESRGGVKL